MTTDLHGLPLTAPSSAAAAAFDETLHRYLAYRADTASPCSPRWTPNPDSHSANA